MKWSLFCRVIDNYGDAGFCLRLARELRARGQSVDFFIDDLRPLAWMQAGDPDPVPALPWPGAAEQPALGEVVIEAFGCELPQGVQAVIGRSRPLWINLEYLSAEPYVERCHGLPSPVMSGPAQGCEKRFCYPGFTAATGGLLLESTLPNAWAEHDPRSWWRRMGWPALPGERQVSVFAYAHAPFLQLAKAVADAPTRLLLSPGLSPPPGMPPHVRIQSLPWLSQTDFDQLLWSCDLNLVRGEDSFVRAQWAGRPFLWHIYPQSDGAHGHKLAAFLRLHGATADPWEVWNGLRRGPLDLTELFSSAARQRALEWRQRLQQGPELAGTLLAWAGLAPGRG